MACHLKDRKDMLIYEIDRVRINNVILTNKKTEEYG